MTREEVLRDPELVPYVRREFFERLTAGLLDRWSALDMARRLDMDIEAPGYAIALLTMPPPPREAADYLSDPAAAVRSGLLAHFLKYSEYVAFPWGAAACAVLIKGEPEKLPGLIRRCVREVAGQYEKNGLDRWTIAASGPAARLEDLPACWEEASRLWAMRYIRPEEHVFLPGGAEAPDMDGPDEAKAPAEPEAAGTMGRALAYIREDLTDPELSLSAAARYAGVTAGYLSALFRKDMGQTFTEYVTARRMERARQLLLDTDLPVGQCARQAGFGDARYFSTLFRRAQGCTPTRFRERREDLSLYNE